MLPVYDIAPLEQRMRGEEASVGFASMLINLYAGLALVLAGVGVYGVLAASVSTRMRELGIRSALGANPVRLQVAVAREGLTVTLSAVLLGLAIIWMLGQTWQALLFDVSASDPGLLSAAALLLVLVGVLASVVPARRASRVDPLSVLRSE